MSDREFESLEQALKYEFRDAELIQRALTHRSFANENRALARADNEKLEYLGDAVLGLAVGHLLMSRFPELGEGELSMARAQMVSEVGLAESARSLCLGDCLFLGKGEERSGGRQKPSILSDAFEAVIAAIYLDAGFDAAREVVERLLEPRLGVLDPSGLCDFKTRLQERAQALLKKTPEYTVLSARGPDHDKTFEVAVIIDGREWARAEGKSKKSAEQKAAAIAAELLETGAP